MFLLIAPFHAADQASDIYIFFFWNKINLLYAGGIAVEATCLWSVVVHGLEVRAAGAESHHSVVRRVYENISFVLFTNSYLSC